MKSLALLRHSLHTFYLPHALERGVNTALVSCQHQQIHFELSVYFFLFVFILAGNPSPAGQLNASVDCSNKHEQDQNCHQNIFPQIPPLRQTQCIEAPALQAKMTPVRSACTLKQQKAT